LTTIDDAALLAQESAVLEPVVKRDKPSFEPGSSEQVVRSYLSALSDDPSQSRDWVRVDRIRLRRSRGEEGGEKLESE